MTVCERDISKEIATGPLLRLRQHLLSNDMALSLLWCFLEVLSTRLSVDLKAGEYGSDHWIKRGVALLMSLET